VWGATGFTGRLVCEHLVRDYQVRGARPFLQAAVQVLAASQQVAAAAACIAALQDKTVAPFQLDCRVAFQRLL